MNRILRSACVSVALVLGAVATDGHAARLGSPDETAPAPGKMSADQVAKELANPNTPLATLTLRTQWKDWDGDLPGASGSDSGNIEFQPAFPFPVGERKNIFFRPSFSYVVNQPAVDPDTGAIESRSGFLDIGYDLAYGYATESGWNFLGGVVGSFPTGADRLSSDTWTLGPELAIAKISKRGVFGLFPNHAWDVSGPAEVSVTTLQPFVVFFLGGGWTIATAGKYTYDWEEEQWTVPANLSLSKTVTIGSLHWKFGFEANYYVQRSDRLGERWMIAFNITPVVPNVFAEWLGAKR